MTMANKPGLPSKSTDIVPKESEAKQPSYLHSVLAQCGLPYRTLPMGQRTFRRDNGDVRLFIEAGTLDGDAPDQDRALPVPSGTKPRLILIHACTQVVLTREPVVELGGNLRTFMRSLGMDIGGKEMAGFRLQANALAACHMRLTFKETGDREPLRVIDRFNPGMRGSKQARTEWDGMLRLSPEFCTSIANHAVPLDMTAVASLQKSAMAMDVYAWLAQRLHRITDSKGIMLPWLLLQKQFADEKTVLRNFRGHFKEMLDRVKAVYPDANFVSSDVGVRLFASYPPIGKRMLPTIKALPSSDAMQLGVDDFELDELTRAELREVAPGWCGDELARRWKTYRNGKERPDKLPKAFIGWARKFTKGKTPDLFTATRGEPKPAAPAPAPELLPGAPIADIEALDLARIARWAQRTHNKGKDPRELAEAFIAAGGLVPAGKRPEDAIAYWQGAAG